MKSKKKAMRISVIIALILLLTGLYLGYVNRYDRMSGDSEPLIQMESGEQTRVSYEEPDWQMNDFFLVDVLNSAFEDYYSGASYAFVNGINYLRVICEENQCEELEKFPNQNYAAAMDKKKRTLSLLAERDTARTQILLAWPYLGITTTSRNLWF